MTRATVAGGGLAVGWWLGRHRTSPAVRRWRPGAGTRERSGRLSVRTSTGGPGGPATVLLHGIVANGDAFGAGFDALLDGGRLVVADLLGFGASMAADTADFRVAAHLVALDDAVERRGLSDAPLTIVGHSMGGVLALHWAAHRAARGLPVRVATICAPLYDTPDEADQRIGALGPLARLIALEHPIARRICAWMCDHRRVSAGLAVALSPSLPVPIARGGVQHTWPAYSGAMDGLIRDSHWRRAVQVLTDAAAPVLLLEGADDPVPTPGRAAGLAARHPTVTHHLRPGAGHDLPLADPRWCVDQIRGWRGASAAAGWRAVPPAAGGRAAPSATPARPVATDRLRYGRGVAAVYDAVSLEHALYARPRSRLMSLVAMPRGTTVIDVGCGTGLNFARLLSDVGPHGRVVGVDASADMLARARRRADAAGWTNVTLLQGAAADLLGVLDRAGIDREDIGAVVATYVLSLLDDGPVWDAVEVLGAGRTVRVGVADFGAPTAAPAPLRLLYRLLVAAGGGDPTRQPWRRLTESSPDPVEEDHLGGHVHLAAGTYRPHGRPAAARPTARR